MALLMLEASLFGIVFRLILLHATEDFRHSLRHALADELADKTEDLIVRLAEDWKGQRARFLALLVEAHV